MKRYRLEYEDDEFYRDITVSSKGEEKYFSFMVDTGASDCCISHRAAVSLGFDLDTIADTRIGVYTATEKVNLKSITLESFEALGRREQNFRIGVMNFPDDTDGVIGNSFLKNFGSIQFNYPDSTQSASIDVGEGPSGRFGYDVITAILKRVKLMRRRALQ